MHIINTNAAKLILVNIFASPSRVPLGPGLYGLKSRSFC
jgi:hypothetical protein